MCRWRWPDRRLWSASVPHLLGRVGIRRGLLPRFADELASVKADLSGDGGVLQATRSGGGRGLTDGETDRGRGRDDGHNDDDENVAALVAGDTFPRVPEDEHGGFPYALSVDVSRHSRSAFKPMVKKRILAYGRRMLC